MPACAIPKVLALRGKVEVVATTRFSTIAAAVEITTADGKIHKLSQAAARGSDVNPMSDADARGQAARRPPPAGIRSYDVRPLIDAIWALDEQRRCFRTGALAVPR